MKKNLTPYLIGAAAILALVWASSAEHGVVKPAQEAADAPQAVEAAPTAGGVGAKGAQPFVESGYRFQFSNCHGTPGSLVVKTDRAFLLDNRDERAHTFAVAGRSYHVGGYSAAVVSIAKAGTYAITCDGGGAASVTVQK